MSTFRKHFRVIWDGGSPVDVVTNARDLAEAQEYAGNPIMATYVMVHSALARHGVDVPGLETFIDQLDELSARNGQVQQDPTAVVAYTTEPSQSPA